MTTSLSDNATVIESSDTGAHLIRCDDGTLICCNVPGDPLVAGTRVKMTPTDPTTPRRIDHRSVIVAGSTCAQSR
jgi:hypothetical protein